MRYQAREAQARSISQVTQGIDQISMIQTNSATAEESAAASEELSASQIQNLVSQFRLKSSGRKQLGTQAEAHASVSRPSSPVSAGGDKY